MEDKPAIYYEINERISQVNDIDFWYEIKQKIEKYQQSETSDCADELSEEQKAELEIAIEESYNEENLISWEAYQIPTSKWR